MCSAFCRVEQPDSMDYTPYPTNEKEPEEPLKDSEDEGVAVELFAGARRNHRANSWSERNAVKNEADHGESVV